MAILKMKKISVFGLHSDRKAVLEELHKKGVVEVCEPGVEEVSFRETEKSIAQFDEYMKAAESALEILDKYAPEKSGFFTYRRVLPLQKYHMSSADSTTTLQKVYQVIQFSDKIREHSESIRKITAKQTALAPYLALDIPMNTYGTEYTLVKVGVLNGTWTAERLQKELEAFELESLHFEILSTSRDYTYIWFVFLKSQKQQVVAFLKNIGFSEPAFSLSHHPPQKKTEVLEEAKQKLTKEIQECVSGIKQHSSYRSDIKLFYDHLSLRKDKYQVLSKIGITEHVFFLEGYIPEKYADSVKQYLENNWMVYVELTDPENPEEVPIAFQNGFFASPVEEITETYSMPSPTDIDPNPVMAFFYYLFFGMMFSDAGYGLLLMLVCGYLGFSKRLEKPKRKNYQMFFFCGISTVFWGLMYGSFFGNIIYTISTTFFGKEITLTPLWLDPVSQALQLLIFSVAFGMIQILTGLTLNFYVLCRQKKVLDAVCDTGFWIVVLLGICLLAAGMGLETPALASIGKWAAVIGAAGIVVTGGRNSKNIFGKMFGGIVGLYNITGYISDALSYSRLMALGVATGCIANVVNMLGTMFGSSVIGTLLFILIAVFGHSLNFAMNMLGAYVHTNRLQYVEFFSKFYEGGGRKFAPFRMNTKYYKFSEE
ncbi:MAG TPA: V-type ATP synthase subunit I [Clostridiales bacterium]|nr:V-type ATP synthase subunit I [Clostridiales bacterium]